MDSDDLPALAAEVFHFGFEGTEPDEPIRAFLARGVSSVILFGRNAPDGQAALRLTRQLTDAAGRPLLISVDQEGGSVLRFRRGATLWPSAMALGRLPPDDVRALGRACGQELRAMGITMNLAPVADINSRVNPGIGTRSFAEDPAVAGPALAAWIEGLQAAGVAATVKHFPGLGAAAVDTHLARTVIARPAAELEAIDLPPFRAAFAAGVRAAMTSHSHYAALDPERPATVSPAVLTGLLRERLGFDGVLVTDDMRMGGVLAHADTPRACVEALLAGADSLLICRNATVQQASLDAVVAAVEAGELPRARLAEAARRVRALRSWVGERTAPAGTLGELTARHARLVDVALDRAVHVLRDRDALLPLTWRGPEIEVLFPELELHTPVEERVTGEAEWLAELCQRLGGATLRRFAPDRAAVRPRTAKRLLFTAEAHLHAAQAELVRACAATGDTVLIPLRTAHEADLAPSIGTVLTAFGYLPNALAALSRRLFGAVK